MSAVTADLVIRNGTIVSPDAAIVGSVAIKDGVVLAVGADEAMPPARETFDATGLHVLPGAIDVHVHFRDPGYPAQGRLGERHGGGGFRRRHHRVRHAEHHSADRHRGNPRRQARHRREQGACRFRPLRPARRGHHRACAGFGRRRRHRLQALYGQHLRQDPVALDRRDAGSLRGGGADRQAHFAARRDQFDHGAPPGASDRGRPARPAGAYRRRAPPWSPSRRSAAPPFSPNGPARAFTSCTSRRPRNCGRCAKAKARGVDITGETCPHYLLLSADDYHDMAGIIRVNPPVREARNQEPLWAALPTAPST